jgi:single-strand DNA-binding protein
MKRITVIGNITADAEVRDVNGVKAINFCIAENSTYKNKKGERVETSTFFNCTVWREKNILISNYLLKGVKVFLEGEPEIEIYQNKEGNTVGAIKINVKNIELLGGGRKPENTQQPNNETKSDLPF